jgi:hypothetical protein
LIANALDLGGWRRDLVVAVTAAHVLVLRIDSVDGQPRWIALAARSSDVRIEVIKRPRITRDAVVVGPDLVVSGSNGQWTIGSSSWLKPDPVLEAWRQATRGTVHTG